MFFDFLFKFDVFALTYLLFVWQEQLQQIRQQYIWHWILDVDNIHRHAILQYYDALLKS